MPAHPRSRGENKTITTDSEGTIGSSPLTRGKLLDLALPAGGARLIPAHAGKTASGQRRARPQPAHPRSRGENFMCSAGLPRMNGSSPLTRGKPKIKRFACLDGRLIPAHAGKTTKNDDSVSVTPAHPRSRGENARP